VTGRRCAAVAAVQDCAQAGEDCIEVFVGSEMVEERADIIRVLLNTVDVCEATARVLSRRVGPDRSMTRALVAACWSACHSGREQCGAYLPIHGHARLCDRACRRTERALRELLASLH
jgi:hypothetical protein